jgi:formylglycine-generating enzyme required for sulfatase activity
MTQKTPIKIIKRKERAAQPAAQEEAVEKKSAQESARDMVATVSEWVSDFQQRRRSETTQALKTLFSDNAPHLTEA